MEVNETAVKKWLEVCQQWSTLDDHLVDLRQELQEFLHLLWKWIANKDSSRAVLQHVPSVGKLLGKLATNPSVLTSDGVFKNMLKCLLSLSGSATCDESNTAKRIRMWSQAQMRNMSTPWYSDSSLLAVAELVGYTAQETTEFIAKKLGESLANDISDVPSCKWNSSSASECEPQITVAGDCLRQLSEICLPLVGLPVSRPIVESLLCCTKSTDIVERGQVTEALSPKFLEAVSNTPQNGSGVTLADETHLSLTARISLWKRYPRGFELEVLNLLERTVVRVSGLTRDEMKDIVSRSQLCQACAECPQLCIYAWEILRTTLVRSQGNVDVFNLMGVFRQSCCEVSRRGTREGLLKADRLFADYQCCS